MRSHAKAVSAIAATCGIVLALGASPAFGAKTVVNTLGSTATGTTGGLFNVPRGVAVNNTGNGGVAKGTTYVVDSGSDRIQRFSPNGAFVSAFGWDVILDGSASDPGNVQTLQTCTVAAHCKAGSSGNGAGQLNFAQGIAVAQNTGTVYVTDQVSRRVNAFAADGKFQGAFGWGALDGSAAFQFCNVVCASPNTTLANGGEAGKFGNFFIGYPAVDATGRIYVGNTNYRRVDVFTPAFSSGFLIGVSFTRAFGWGVDTGAAAFEVCTVASTCQAGSIGNGLGQFGLSAPSDLAVDSTGNVYALDSTNNRVQKFDATPAPLTATFGATDLSANFGAGLLRNIAVDTATGNLFVSASSANTIPAEQIRIAELDSTGTLVPGAVHGTDLTVIAANGLAASPASVSGNAFLSSADGGHRVFVLNNPATASLDDITIKTATTATFSGLVDPTGGALTCTFQHSTNGIDWTDLPEPDCASLAPGGGPQAISQGASGLQPNKPYSVRLTVTKAGVGSITTPVKTFSTDPAPPLVSDTAATGISDTAATFNAKVNPQNQATAYRFEYTDDADFQANGFASATKVPSPDASAGSGGTAIPVSQAIAGLAPSTTYHFRVVATNASSPPGGTAGPEATFATYPAPPTFDDPCPNDAFRTGASAKLPDCRAYEQASAVDKNGGDAQGSSGTNSLRASTDGDAVTFINPAGLPGGEGAQSNPLFLARRSAGNWSTRGLLPPASYGSDASLQGWTPDLSQIFANASSFDSGAAFLLRSGLDGSITEVVDGGEGRLAGAGADGRSVFFQSNDLLASEAAPGENNLYVWDRDSGIVTLAGVLPDGSTPPGGSFAGSYHWILGTNDTTLGQGGVSAGYFTQDQHAVSNQGSVYFTAGDTGQLYLRTDPTGASASTEHVSASEKTNGVGLGGTDPSGPLPAAFQFATPDGEHAFFTSSEELTDDAYTGPRPNDLPAIARAEVDGSNPDKFFVPTPSASGVGNVAVNADFIYWSDDATDSIGRVEIDGDNRESTFITGLDNPQGITLDSNYIYWTAGGDGKTGNGVIGRATLDGTTEVNQDFITGLDNPQGIAVDTSRIYWSSGAIGFNEKRFLYLADLSGENVEPFGSSDEGLFPWGGPGTDIAVDSSYIYFSKPCCVRRIPVTNLTQFPQNVVETADEIQAIALDDAHLYWADHGNNVIGRSDLDGANLTGSFIADVPAAQGLAVDAGHLYWTANPPKFVPPGNDLYRYDAATGDLTDLTSLPAATNGAEVQGVLGVSDDGDRVYFVANGDLDGGGDAAPGDCKQQSNGNYIGACNLYLSDAGSITFIAHLDMEPPSAFNTPPADDANWQPTGSLTFGEKQPTARVSSDGNVLLFRSASVLTSYDNSRPCRVGGAVVSNDDLVQPCPQFYRYDASANEVICVSCNPTGASPANMSFLSNIEPFQQRSSSGGSFLTRNLSVSGDRIFFETNDKLLATDTNGDDGCPAIDRGGGFTFDSCVDVYEWEAEGAGSCATPGGCLYLLSTGASSSPSFFADASASGDDVFIFTRDRLVPQDQDDLVDVYDASVVGGLVAQHQVTPPPCEGEACRGASSAAASTAAAGTAVFQGPGNRGSQPGKPSRCPKGKRRVRRAGKARCVSKKRHSKRRNRNADTTRRASR